MSCLTKVEQFIRIASERRSKPGLREGEGLTKQSFVQKVGAATAYVKWFAFEKTGCRKIVDKKLERKEKRGDMMCIKSLPSLSFCNHLLLKQYILPLTREREEEEKYSKKNENLHCNSLSHLCSNQVNRNCKCNMRRDNSFVHGLIYFYTYLFQKKRK